MNIARIAAMCLAIVLPSCTSLEAVNTMSGQLVTASQSWDAVGRDIQASCERENMFRTTPAPCNDPTRASEELVAANTVLRNYFRALQDAAKSTNFSLSTGISAVGTAAGNLEPVDTDRANAVSGVAGTLARMITDGMREATLRDLIDNGAPLAHEIINAIQSSSVPALRSAYRSEYSAINMAYFDHIGTPGQTLSSEAVSCPNPRFAVATGAPNDDSLTPLRAGLRYVLTQDYCTRIATINSRRNALDSYDRSLTGAAAVLVELQTNSARLGADELAASLYTTGRELDRRIQAVRDAFE